MRRISEIKDLPISQLTDEEICKAAMHRLNSKVCALFYRGDDGQLYYCYRFRDKIGKSYWNKVQMSLTKLWHKLDTKINNQFKM